MKDDVKYLKPQEINADSFDNAFINIETEGFKVDLWKYLFVYGCVFLISCFANFIVKSNYTYLSKTEPTILEINPTFFLKYQLEKSKTVSQIFDLSLVFTRKNSSFDKNYLVKIVGDIIF